MKNKIVQFVLIVMIIFTLSSCKGTKIVDMDNIEWKSDRFNITTTSEQLQNQTYHNNDIDLPDNYYSKITLVGKIYSCRIYLQDSDFLVFLYDSKNNEQISFYSEKMPVLEGYYDNAKKVRNKAYDYIITIRLFSSDYYDYCVANNLKDGDYYKECQINDVQFEEKMTLYGYKDK